MTTNPIYTRIAKLLALANSVGATEAEATLAAEHVQRLLQDHQLTLSQVEAHTGQLTDSPREKTARRGAMYKWQQDLMRSLADNNFCLHHLRESRAWGAGSRTAYKDGKTQRYTIEKQHVVVGRELNVRVTLDTYDYLCAAINRAAQEAGHDTKRLTRAVGWFREGAVTRLTERLYEIRRAREQESTQTAQGNGTHRELVLSDAYGSENDLNNDFLNGFPAGTTAARRREREARRAAQEVERERMVAEGMEATEAFYRSLGYGERAVELAAGLAAVKPARHYRSGTGWTQSDEDHARKVSSPEYAAGREAGDKISLDRQVGHTAARALPHSAG